MHLDEIVVVFMIVLLAGFVQGLTSFGFALISMPLLVKLMPLQQAVPVVVALSLLTNIAVMYSSRKHIRIRQIWPLLVASLLAAPLGTYALIYVPANALKLGAGMLVAVVSILMLSGRSLPLGRLAYAPVGALSGFLNGSISMSGPPAALFLTNQGLDKMTFRANITAYSLILNIITIGTYVYEGLLNQAAMETAGWAVPALIIGVIIGIKAVGRLNDRLFKTIALWLILVTGLWTAVNGIIG
ncbi:sulfite exporter TauE/SafE family protein [Paenibacillus glycanilyticus]|uniref:sulfite exporter TauE/SafE family protein n=1 Tax=Paenibacillus glycanilyticus TaxID=126569 RepID=UPI00203DDB69|nr:sulfite exporter TauE/SafE family protein [Paenibacillus glycanilyticus]MCM3629184.1 sulfite exporter TauE/SafE family protein [Paenibacillus glycanilyticus]